MPNRDFFYIEMLILKLLEEEDHYGYQLSQLISKRSGNVIDLKEGPLYPTVYRMAEKGYSTEHKELVGKRRQRVYYHIEPSGKEHLKKLADRFREVTSAVNDMISQ